MRSRVSQFALAALLTAVAAIGAQAQGNLAVVQHIAVVPSSKGLSVQITTDRAVRPHLSRLDNPIRIVIDLEGAVLPGGWRRIPVKNQDISEVRASQWKQSPPIARVVVQLRVAHEFSVISTGNKVALWLLPGASQRAAEQGGATTEAQAQTPAAPAVPAPTPVSQPATTYEPVANFETLHGAQSVMAMGNPTVLRLPRGGEIHVCPGTSLSVTPSKSGRDLMLGLSTGTIETHYPLGAAADVILTPDFRILLPGPGEFDMAVSADNQGNTCVRTLPGNTAAAVVSEIMGNDTYQVNAGDQVLFHGGRLQSASAAANLSCGCPLRTVPVMRAEGQQPAAPPAAPSAAVLAPPASGGPPARINMPASDPAPALPSGTPVQVEAPFIFRATQPKGPDVVQVAELHFSNDPPPELLKLPVTGPARVTYYKVPRTKLAASNNKPRGFFARVRGFFGNMFR